MRFHREATLFDYEREMLAEQKERSHEVYELARAISEQDMAFNKVVDRQVKTESKIAVVAPNLLNGLN